ARSRPLSINSASGSDHAAKCTAARPRATLSTIEVIELLFSIPDHRVRSSLRERLRPPTRKTRIHRISTQPLKNVIISRPIHHRPPPVRVLQQQRVSTNRFRHILQRHQLNKELSSHHRRRPNIPVTQLRQNIPQRLTLHPRRLRQHRHHQRVQVIHRSVTNNLTERRVRPQQTSRNHHQ